MKIESCLFGSTEINPEAVIEFPCGLPGFEDCARFTLLHEEGAQNVHYLQSVDEPALALSVIDPSGVQLFYEFDLDDEDVGHLDYREGDELQVLVMVYRPDDTAVERSGVQLNTMGPLVINMTRRRGLQKVLATAERTVTIRSE